jgi:outer membrane receptor for ferrienterochelin and colicin
MGQNIQGTVFGKDGTNGKIPLPGVNIYWAGSQHGTVTNAQGRFELDGKETGHDHDHNLLIASFVGYENDTLHVDDLNGDIEILLTNNATLDEYVVTERQKSSFISQISPVQVQTITSAELQKAACCNLSESFETNASVDVSYSDAVSGAKKIELLGLHGKYSQMMTENIPNLRGLSTTYGLGYIPGTWMESIQISKGAASVVNGYESITGQINIEYKKPDDSEKAFFNVYANHIGKLEGNFNGAVQLNKKWSTMLYAHVENLSNKVDHNGDSFLDEPLIRQYNVFNRWKYVGDHYMAQFGFKVLDEERTGGQEGFDPKEMPQTPNYYGINIETRRYEAWGKAGYIFEGMEETSLGFVNSYTWHEQDSYFGLNDYTGTESNYYANLIFQSVIGNHRHKYSTGASYNYDAYREMLNDSSFNRTERVPGLFFQYTYSNEKNLTVLLGIRSDFHNIWGTFYTPRFHAKYNLNEHTILRASAGKGYRTPNIIAENSYLLASSRQLIVQTDIRQEEAWNYGVNLTRIIDIADREMSINAEVYRTDFINQMVIDRDKNVAQINIYNLDGKSFSTSYQVEISYELIPRLDVVTAFRYNDVRMTYDGELEREPLVNRYKGLLNLSYKTNLDKWQFDFTTQLNGDSRLPSTGSNPVQYQRPDNAPAYTILNAQITKYFRKWNIYVGAENLTNFVQDDPVIAADDPFGPYFDSSIVWGPIMGRKIYAGLKFSIN